MKPIENKEDKDSSECPENDACTNHDILRVTKNSESLLVVMGPLSKSQLITSKSQSFVPSTRYLNEKFYYNIVEAEECNNDVMLVNTNASKLWVVRTFLFHY